MNHNISVECLYCSTPVATSIAKQQTCPSCWSNFNQTFGPNWYEQEWHTSLLPGYVAFVRESKLLHQAMSIEQDNVDFSIEDVVEPARLAKKVRHQHIFQAVATLHVVSGLGCRRIKRALDESDMQPKVDLATVKRYLRLAKQELGRHRATISRAYRCP